MAQKCPVSAKDTIHPEYPVYQKQNESIKNQLDHKSIKDPMVNIFCVPFLVSIFCILFVCKYILHFTNPRQFLLDGWDKQTELN